jgi:hypothetical protein
MISKKMKAMALVAGIGASLATMSAMRADAGWWAARQLNAGEGAEWAAAGAVGYLGAEAGAWAGGEVGAMIGTAAGPVGTVVGGAIGAGVGAL